MAILQYSPMSTSLGNTEGSVICVAHECPKKSPLL